MKHREWTDRFIVDLQCFFAHDLSRKIPQDVLTSEATHFFQGFLPRGKSCLYSLAKIQTIAGLKQPAGNGIYYDSRLPP